MDQGPDRSGLLKRTLSMLMGTVVVLATLIASPLPATSAFTLRPLPNGASAVEPTIDARTMTIPHDRHHAAYVSNLNAQIRQNPDLANLSLVELQKQISGYPTAVRNN